MKAFVTGGTGLLGGNLVRLLLEQGHEVKALARSPQKARALLGQMPNLAIVQGDMEDVDAFAAELQGCDVLFHTAAYFRDYYGNGDHWPILQRINVDGTLRLLNAAEQRGIRKVSYVSSAGVIDASSHDMVDETILPGKLQQTNLYFRSKVLAEKALLEWLKQHPLPVVQILPVWIWGPGDAGPTASGQLVLDFLNRKLPGAIEGQSNIIDARDVAQAMINAVDKGRSGERYIIANGKVTFDDILRALAKASGVPAPSMRIPYPLALVVAFASELVARLRGKDTLITVEGIRTLQDRAVFSAAKAKRELGFSPRPFDETVRDSVAWYRQFQPEKLNMRTPAATLKTSAR